MMYPNGYQGTVKSCTNLCWCRLFLYGEDFYGKTRIDSVDDKRKYCQTNYWLCDTYIYWVSFSTTLQYNGCIDCRELLGQNALAAVTGVGSLIFLFVGFFNGFATGASVIIANAIGAQDEERTKKAVYTTATFGIILGLIMTVSGYLLTDQMLIWMGLPIEVFSLSSIYLKIYFQAVFLWFYITCLWESSELVVMPNIHSII